MSLGIIREGMKKLTFNVRSLKSFSILSDIYSNEIPFLTRPQFEYVKVTIKSKYHFLIITKYEQHFEKPIKFTSGTIKMVLKTKIDQA